MDRKKLFHIDARKGLPYITGKSALSSYAFAYWKAARGMIDHKMYSGTGRPDFSTFPIVFLYRHAMELLLKGILIEHHQTYSKNPEPLLRRGHRLDLAYLKDLRTVTGNAGILSTGEPVIQITESEWSEIETVLREWDERDPDSMAFRYSINKRNTGVLIESDFTFDVENFAEIMENVLGVLAHLRAELFHSWYQDFLGNELLVDEPRSDTHD